MDQRIKRSRQQERAVAESLGGRVNSRSGAGPTHKGDVLSDRFLVECKRTDNRKSITIKIADMDKIELEAALAGRLPLMAIEIGSKKYYLSPDWVLEGEIHGA